MQAGLAVSTRPRLALAARITVAVLACAGLAWLAHRNRDTLSGACSLALQHWALCLPCLALSTVFLAAKAMALSAAAAAAGASCTLPRSARIFVEGAVIEAITWPGKVWADAYRVRRFDSLSLGLRSVLLWRAAGLAATVIVAACASGADLLSAPSSGVIRPLGLAVTLVLGIVLARRVRSRVHAATIARSAGWSLIASCADLASVAVIVFAIAGVGPVSLLPVFVLVSVAATASMVPFGAGVLDTGVWLVLTTKFKVPSDAAIACLLLYRVCGPGITLACGLLSLVTPSGVSQTVQTTGTPTVLPHRHESVCLPQPKKVA